MSKKKGDNNESNRDNTKISERVIQYMDDPKNSSALAKIHEMSNKAKHAGKSPAQYRRFNIMNVEEDDRINKNQSKVNYVRRSGHYATVKNQNINLINKNLRKGENNSNNKKEYVGDKTLNRLVEKEGKHKEGKGTIKEKTFQQEKKNEYIPKRQFQKESEPIKEDQEKEEKNEIIEKLKQYRKNKQNDINNKKRIAIQVPKGNEKYSEIVYEKKIVKEGEDEEDDFEKEIQGAKTKVYKKILKNEPGTKVIITKKIIEENIEKKDEKLVFDDSSDEEDITKELKKLKINPSELTKGNIKVKVITEEYDEKGNKIYSKEVTTNKLPKGLKGNDEITDEFEKFEEEFDE